MSSHHLSTTGPDPDLVVQLLRETDWVRSLARSLLRGEADAEDLAQEAMLAALEAHGPRSPRRLRAWLAVTLRRKASDHHRRRASRLDGLHLFGRDRAAAAEAPALGSDERLALHEELARALRELPQAERDLLLRRHVDQVPPRQLAEELGVTSEQVRKRLMRALDQVRQKLRQSDRGEAGWNLGLLALIVPQGLTAGLAPETLRGSGASVSLTPSVTVAAMSFAKLLLVSAIILVIGITTWIRTADSAPLPLPKAVASTTDLAAEVVLPLNDPGQSAGRVPLESEAPRVELAATSEPAPPTVRIVDQAGVAVLDAHGAWLDSASNVHEFEPDYQGRFELKAGEPARVFLRSQSLVAVYRELPAMEAGAVREIVLAPRPTLSFRVTVSGNEPGEVIAFHSYGSPLMDSIDSSQALVRSQLEKAGFPLPRPRVECTPQGLVKVELPEARAVLSLSPQDGYVPAALMSRAGEPRRGASFEAFSVRMDEPETLVDLLRLPSLSGRWVWKDTREPYTGEFFYAVENRKGYDIGGSVTTSPSSDGRFRVPLHGRAEVHGEDWLRLSNQPGGIQLSDVLKEGGVTVRISPFSTGAAQEDLRFKVPPESGDIDVGEILVARIPRLNVMVLGEIDGEWRPVPAAVASSKGVVKTDEGGSKSLFYWPGDTLDVVAVGYDLMRVVVPDDLGNEPLVIRLTPAPSLTIVVPERLLDPSGQRMPQVVIGFEATPFGSWNDALAPPLKWTSGLHRTLFGPMPAGFSKVQQREVFFPVPASGVLQIPGLRRGATFDVSLADHKNELYTTCSVVLDEASRLDDWPTTMQPAFLSVTLSNSDGEAPESGRYQIRGKARSGYYAEFSDGAFQVGPIAPGLYRINVYWDDSKGEKLTHTISDVDVVAGENVLDVELASD